jgi:glycosyltransferase involved in cell wall biosynthesis
MAAIGYFVALAFEFPYLLLRHNPDVIVEDFGAPISTFGLGRLTRRPLVGVVQWLNAADKGREYHLPFAWVESFGLRSQKRLIAVSEEIAAQLRLRAPGAQVSVIRNGVDEEAFGELPPAPAGLPAAYIGYLGRLETAQKGLDLLLDAYALIAPAVSADLVLAGVGPGRGSLEARAAAAGIAERVHFIGHLEGAARFRFLASALIVAMPSRFETFGLVAIEAAAMGTPVVAFDLPVLREVIQDGQTGILTPPFEPAAYAAGLLSLLENPQLRAQMAPAARALGAALRWEEAATATLALLREAVAEGSPQAHVTALSSSAHNGPTKTLESC